MFSIIRIIFLSCFIFYAVSPVSYAHSHGKFLGDSPPAGAQSNIRLFLLEYFFNALQQSDSDGPLTNTYLSHRPKVLLSPDLYRRLISMSAGEDAFSFPPLPVISLAVTIERAAPVIRPVKVLSSNHSPFSPPSF